MPRIHCRLDEPSPEYQPRGFRIGPGDKILVPAGGTSAWKLCSANKSSSLTVYFDVVAAHGIGPAEGSPFYLQFITHYQHACGQHRMRVVTSARCWTTIDSHRVRSEILEFSS